MEERRNSATIHHRHQNKICGEAELVQTVTWTVYSPHRIDDAPLVPDARLGQWQYRIAEERLW